MLPETFILDRNQCLDDPGTHGAIVQRTCILIVGTELDPQRHSLPAKQRHPLAIVIQFSFQQTTPPHSHAPAPTDNTMMSAGSKRLNMILSFPTHIDRPHLDIPSPNLTVKPQHIVFCQIYI